MKVRVSRWLRFPDTPWVILCPLCEGNGWLGFAFAPHRVAATHDLAVNYAQRHALEHEKTRCPACLHVPDEPLASEKANA